MNHKNQKKIIIGALIVLALIILIIIFTGCIKNFNKLDITCNIDEDCKGSCDCGCINQKEHCSGDELKDCFWDYNCVCRTGLCTKSDKITTLIDNLSDYKCEDKIFAGKGYSICGYGITNPEIIPKDISYEHSDRFSGSIKTYSVTGKIWEEQLAPCPDTDDSTAIPQQCGTRSKYIEIKSIEVVK